MYFAKNMIIPVLAAILVMTCTPIFGSDHSENSHLEITGNEQTGYALENPITGRAEFSCYSSAKEIELENGESIFVLKTRNRALTAAERKVAASVPVSTRVTVVSGDGSWSISDRYTGFAGASEGRILLYYISDAAEPSVAAFDYSGNRVFDLNGISKIGQFSSSLAAVNVFDFETGESYAYYVGPDGAKKFGGFYSCTDFDENGHAVVFLYDRTCGVLGTDGMFVISPKYDAIILDGAEADAVINGAHQEILFS